MPSHPMWLAAYFDRQKRQYDPGVRSHRQPRVPSDTKGLGFTRGENEPSPSCRKSSQVVAALLSRRCEPPVPSLNKGGGSTEERKRGRT